MVQLGMGVNWNQGLMRWQPYIDATGQAYPLNHLHPVRYTFEVTHATKPVMVEIRVAFAVHCFTRDCVATDRPSQFYRDAREIRTFCHERYALSPKLPEIARALTDKKCGFAKNENYVSIETPTVEGTTIRYGVFFNVMKAKRAEGPAVLLTIQSAYELNPRKQLPGRGGIWFRRLIELTLAGIKPRPPH